MTRRIAHVAAASALVALAMLWWAPPSGADHAGETITVSKTTGLQDGETVTVSFTHFTPGGVDGQHPNAKIVIAGQGKLTTIPDKLNFSEYASAPTAVVQPDGTGSAQFTVTIDHGTVQDGTTLDCSVQQCWIIAVQEPFLPQPNYASVPISFGSAAPPPTAAPTSAPPVTAPPSTAAPVAEVTTTTATASTTTTSAAATTTTRPETVDVANDGDGDGGNTGLIVGLVAAGVAVVGAGAFLATRKRGEDDESF